MRWQQGEVLSRLLSSPNSREYTIESAHSWTSIAENNGDGQQKFPGGAGGNNYNNFRRGFSPEKLRKYIM